jgi:hypothetical protein
MKQYLHFNSADACVGKFLGLPPFAPLQVLATDKGWFSSIFVESQFHYLLLIKDVVVGDYAFRTKFRLFSNET